MDKKRARRRQRKAAAVAPPFAWPLPDPSGAPPAPEILAIARAIARGLAAQHDDEEEAAVEAAAHPASMMDKDQGE